ncbi:hypothetical protein QJS10_CPA16g00485 [Acorus calamus]|uniref:Uncharacterized protein n=1 Tax=Acorus calamus TaxID=4465 RepID=A0AAV9D1W4_ACOCL|nr:hypothetical protein QJS10_CPA16g00485 [Acorus calamus]
MRARQILRWSLTNDATHLHSLVRVVVVNNRDPSLVRQAEKKVGLYQLNWQPIFQ